MDSIDEVAVECFAEYLGASFDEDAGDIATTEVAQDVGEGTFFVHERAAAVGVGEEARARREISGPCEDDAPWLTGTGDAADGKAGVIGAQGAGADKDGVDLGAKLAGIGAGALVGEPLALRGEAGDAAVK